MENASKALIIAGAILLSILIIGLGMRIFNQANDLSDGGGLETEKARSFNESYEANMGLAKKGSNVKELLKQIRSHNLTEEDTDEHIGVIVGSGSAITDPIAINEKANTIMPNKKYDVTVTKYNEEGYIREVKIEENKGTTSGGGGTTGP